MNKSRPPCLSIAGFDPSGGAGLLADIKTFEANKVNGMGVVTCLTFQNDSEFDGIKWIESDEVIRQLEILFRKFTFEYIKIGMVKDLETIEKIILFLFQNHSNTQVPKIIWDPILRTSAGSSFKETSGTGFEIHHTIAYDKFLSVCQRIYLITPNMDEIKILMNNQDAFFSAKELSRYCNVFLKGGHLVEEKPKNSEKGKDYLFIKEGKIFPYRAKKISAFSKHGSGCVVSSAITANLSSGETLPRSCLMAKNYVTDFMMSSKNLIGYHKI